MSALVDKADRPGELSSDAPVVQPSDVIPEAAVDSAALDDRVGDDAPVDDGAEHDLVADSGAADESAPYDGDADEGAGHDVAGDADGGTPDGQAVDEAEDDAMAGDEASQNGQAYDGVGSVSKSPAYDGGVYYGFNGDRDAMSDVDVLAGMVDESLEELLGTVAG